MKIVGEQLSHAERTLIKSEIEPISHSLSQVSSWTERVITDSTIHKNLSISATHYHRNVYVPGWSFTCLINSFNLANIYTWTSIKEVSFGGFIRVGTIGNIFFLIDNIVVPFPPLVCSQLLLLWRKLYLNIIGLVWVSNILLR